jgi:uncharacterized protein YkwD
MRTILGSLLVTVAVLAAPSAGLAATRVSYQAGSEQQVLILLNQIRRERGLGPLVFSTPLRVAARGHTADMLQNGYFDHDSPGEAWDTRVSRFVKSSAVGETIARGRGATGTPAGIIYQWMHSMPHRRVILNPALRFVGVGVASGTPGAIMATADFAS